MNYFFKNFEYKQQLINKPPTMTMFAKKNFSIFLIVSILILNSHVGGTSTVASATRSSDMSLSTKVEKCSNFEKDYDYQHFIFLYKDNVFTVEECCAFCNSNERCIVWSLQAEIGRCYLKYDRGVKVYSAGFTSGFSNSCKHIKINEVDSF